MPELTGPRGVSRSPVSIVLSRADRHASRPAVAVFVVTAAVAWLIVSVVKGFPPRWETIFQTAVSALTLAMLFVIQHTQARHQRATQRKLDEILLEVIRPRVEAGLKFLVLLTKADKLNRSEQNKALSIARLQTAGGDVKLFSALKKQGVEEASLLLWNWTHPEPS